LFIIASQTMQSTDKRPLSWLLQQFQLKLGKSAIFSGLRSLVILGVPIGIGMMTNHEAESAIASEHQLFYRLQEEIEQVIRHLRKRM
jgi:hypothetical protein